MNTTFNNIVAAYASSKSIIKLVEQNEALTLNILRQGATSEKSKMLHNLNLMIDISRSALEKSLTEIFSGQKIKIPEYNGWNFEQFEAIANTIDRTIPNSSVFDDKVLENAKMELLSTLTKNNFIEPAKKKKLNDVKRSVEALRKNEPDVAKQKNNQNKM